MLEKGLLAPFDFVNAFDCQRISSSELYLRDIRKLHLDQNCKLAKPNFRLLFKLWLIIKYFLIFNFSLNNGLLNDYLCICPKNILNDNLLFMFATDNKVLEYKKG